MAYWRISFDKSIPEYDFEKYLLMVDVLSGSLRDLPPYIFDQIMPAVAGKRPQSLRSQTTRDSIRATVAIEGNPITENDAEITLGCGIAKNKDEQEILNMKSVTDFIKNPYADEFISEEFISGDSISENLILSLHARITKDISGVDSGKYRTSPVVVGKSHHPPRPDEIRSLMKQFIEFMNSDSMKKVHPAIRAISAHFYLVSIHPFEDGNGRTSRALESWILHQGKIDADGIISLNSYYYRNYEQYFEELDHARFRYSGKIESFIRFGLKGLLEEMKCIDKSARMLMVRNSYLQYVSESVSQKKITQRQADLAVFIMNECPIAESAVRSKGMPALKKLYKNIQCEKTIKRDLDSLKNQGFVFVRDSVLYFTGYSQI